MRVLLCRATTARVRTTPRTLAFRRPAEDAGAVPAVARDPQARVGPAPPDHGGEPQQPGHHVLGDGRREARGGGGDQVRDHCRPVLPAGPPGVPQLQGELRHRAEAHRRETGKR
eukprot:1179773-Prorocentrum_minimum.AAC.2